MEIIKMGSLHFNGSPVPTGQECNREQISFGDTVPGMDIPFIKWGNIFVADRCVCVGVSWEDLDKHGFIFGRPVRIDGTSYLCRSLKVGAEEGVPNEWDALLDTFGEDDDLWHWSDHFFWGQEPSGMWPECLVIRGYNSARFWLYNTASYRNMFVGFRPVLEPLSPEATISDATVGSNLKLYGSNWSIAGRLIGYDDYDLELAADSPIPEACSWIRQAEDTIFVNRDAITYLCEGSNNHNQK